MRQEYTIFRGTAKPQAAFTVVASTDIFTVSAHGLAVGDCVQLTTDGTLPVGLSLLTNYYVISPTTNTFQLSATPNGTAVDVTNAGGSTNTYHLYGKAIYTGDWRSNNLSIEFLTSPTMTVKVQGSFSEDAPDFNATQSSTNRWGYMDITDQSTDTSVDGATGVACTGTAVHGMYKITDEGLRWMTVVITAYTQGNLGVTARVFDLRHE